MTNFEFKPQDNTFLNHKTLRDSQTLEKYLTE
jgi:hypothetical protein